MTISASFSNCTMTRRISYNSGYAADMLAPDVTPDLIWYKCVVGGLGTNTIKTMLQMQTIRLLVIQLSVHNSTKHVNHRYI